MQCNIAILLVASQESYPLQRQHILVVVSHLIVVLLPHINKLITINQTDELIATRCSMFGICDHILRPFDFLMHIALPTDIASILQNLFLPSREFYCFFNFLHQYAYRHCTSVLRENFQCCEHRLGRRYIGF